MVIIAGHPCSTLQAELKLINPPIPKITMGREENSTVKTTVASLPFEHKSYGHCFLCQRLQADFIQERMSILLVNPSSVLVEEQAGRAP